MNFILHDDIKEIHVREIAMMFFPNTYKTLPLEVSVFDNKVTAKLGKNTHTETVTLNKKNAVKKCVYILLSSLTGKTFPYGILTGVKPLAVLDNYKTLNNTKKIQALTTNHLILEEKAKLLIETKATQEKYIKKLEHSLYINIPFCPSKCTYCSFPSYVCKNKSDNRLLGSYVSSLIKEIESLKPLIENKKFNPKYIYIGGGTPSILTKTQIKKLLHSIATTINMNNIKEFTFEAGRSDMIDKEKLSILKEYNISRISLNPQSTNDDITANYNRNIPYSNFLEIFEEIKNLGFNSVNCDIILGLDKNNPETSYEDIEKIISLYPDNITIHTLALKRASELTKINYSSSEFYKTQNKILSLLKSNNYLPYYLYKQKLAIEGGDNIGMCKNSKICYYNIMTMNNKSTILALGAGGAGKIYSPGNNSKQVRIDTGKDPKTYINNIDEIIKRKLKKYQGLL